MAQTLDDKRIDALINLIPPGRTSVLDVGARTGKISKILTRYFAEVTALDLALPDITDPHITPIVGDVSHLDLNDGSFDTVVCTEVLEHIQPQHLLDACKELVRVARFDIIISVPDQQDLRIGQTDCASCSGVNPPWGHVNSFSVDSLEKLFPKVQIEQIKYIGAHRERTNSLSSFLIGLAGNPYGTYEQEELCIHCGASLLSPQPPRFFTKILWTAGVALSKLQGYLLPEKNRWIYLLMSKGDVGQ